MSKTKSKSTLEAQMAKLMQGDAKGYFDILDQMDYSQCEKWCDYDAVLDAINTNDKDLIARILDNKCCVSRPQEISKNHNTPLHLAASKPGWCDIVEKIVEEDARVYDVNEDGNTPLHLAFINNASHRVIQLLLDEFLYNYFEKYQCARDIRNKDGLGIFHIACSKSDEYMVEQFYSKDKFDISAQVSPLCGKPYAGYSPLHFAVEAGNHDVAKYLCMYESEIYVFTPNGSSPLHLALEKRDFGMVNLLCMNDLRYHNYVNNNGTTHFMAACANCDPTWVKMYLANRRHNDPETMLNARVKDDSNYPNAGYTPLHFACVRGRDAIVDLLLKLDVHLTLASDNLTPFDIIRMRFKEETEKEVKDIYREVYNMFREHCKICKKCKKLVIANDKRLKEIEAKELEEKKVEEQLHQLSLAGDEKTSE